MGKQKMKTASALLCVLGTTAVRAQGINFGGATSGSSRPSRPPSSNEGQSGSSSSSSDLKDDTDTKFFGITSGNEAVDGGIVGGLGGLAAGAVIASAINGANNNQNPCGRRRRRSPAETDTKFFNFGGGS